MAGHPAGNLRGARVFAFQSRQLEGRHFMMQHRRRPVPPYQAELRAIQFCVLGAIVAAMVVGSVV